MIAQYSSTQKRLFHITVVTLLTLTILTGTLFMLAHASRPAQTSSGFTFTALGDYAETSETTANLNYIAQSGASFNLALGDLNYSPSKVSASAYASYVQSHLSANFPFEIIAGNEDQAQLSALATDLPDHIGNISGNYAKEYYFDYPPGSPCLVRGAGSVMVINGTGGETPLMGTNSSDPNAGYYRKWEGGNSNATWGVLKITVSTTQLSVRFVGTSGGSFSDSFTIA